MYIFLVHFPIIIIIIIIITTAATTITILIELQKYSGYNPVFWEQKRFSSS